MTNKDNNKNQFPLFGGIEIPFSKEQEARTENGKEFKGTQAENEEEQQLKPSRFPSSLGYMEFLLKRNELNEKKIKKSKKRNYKKSKQGKYKLLSGRMLKYIKKKC